MERRTIVLATYGAARENEHADLMMLLRYELGYIVLETRRHAQIDIARSLLASTALANGADVVVFIDHDILFEPTDVEKLADIARETHGVVGAIYSERKLGGRMVGGISPQVTELVAYEGGGLYPAVGVVGMGFTAIHHEAFERLHALPEYAPRRSQDGDLRPYFQKLVVDGYWMHEDASFCHVVRQQGGRTDLDTRFRVQHVGTHPYTLEDCRRKVQQEPSLRFKLRADPPE